ncbi:hypothetical protein CMS2637 [Clavibacter sepedonicus]|uniref:Uncharacterized protein n=1 Tax=Clavibacter sepedonicus TaxID=31964 RepID=B0RIS7_CLASE|nr:hypothetical protein CMS2637 [Clavibacter sepedonicus]
MYPDFEPVIVTVICLPTSAVRTAYVEAVAPETATPSDHHLKAKAVGAGVQEPVATVRVEPTVAEPEMTGAELEEKAMVAAACAGIAVPAAVVVPSAIAMARAIPRHVFVVAIIIASHSCESVSRRMNPHSGIARARPLFRGVLER